MKTKINKEKLYRYIDNHPQMSQAAIARVFHCTRARVNQLIKERIKK